MTTGRAPKRSSFGTIRKLPSGRYQARYTVPGTDKLINAPMTYTTKGDADAWLRAERSARERGTWRPAESSTQTLRDYAERWLADRKLKPSTRKHYRVVLDKFILDQIGDRQIAKIDRITVRSWHADLGRVTGPVYKAHAYRLLSTIMHGAVDDELITTSPCTLRNAGAPKPDHEPEPATLDELATIVDNMPERYRLLVHLAAWCALRYGELAELRRKDVNLTAGVIRVRRGVTWVDGEAIVGPPKSKAGIRDVAIPPHVIPLIKDHQRKHPGLDEALLFPAPRGAHMTHQRFYVWWRPAREAAGRPDLRVHDLRHTGATYAAQNGATLAELMHRLGHSTPQTAMRYQHAVAQRDKALAAKLSEMATGATS
ncbi:MAG TPA: site-specific integrase [Jatrophihabitantaceae bacterium]|nr:site-specific integrase [Jatrophihabitantaceae bacterium]